MGCLTHRKKQTQNFVDQKWDYINLNDFQSKGCGTVFAYAYLWFSLILSVAVYVVDTFTAVQLLAFNRWSSQIEPAIRLSISKWIFSVCIILSFVNLAFEGVRAYRVVRRGNIAECYMDPLAVRWESVRLGAGQGWRRFLVFTELTKSKKGAHYVALFTYFNFQAWIRVIFCMGPRQVVNALTLRSVYMARLAVSSRTVEGSIASFFHNLELLAEEDLRQAAILSGMLFTLVIWVFSALFLILAVLFYLFFLFHWIPNADGGLTGYCERSVNKALLRIVSKHVNTALAKAGEKSLWPLDPAALPTLPNVAPPEPPAYTSRPTTPRHPDLCNAMAWEPLPAPCYYSSRAPTQQFLPQQDLAQSPTQMDRVPPYTPPPRNLTRSTTGPRLPHPAARPPRRTMTAPMPHNSGRRMTRPVMPRIPLPSYNTDVEAQRGL